MFNEPIEEVYFNWLYNKVAFLMNPTPSLTFYKLLRDFHNIEFLWTIAQDSNRAQDGLDIRKEFFRESFLDKNVYWQNIGCSVLEMLIALSRRAEFNTDTSARDWFWIFIENLGLSECNDASDEVTEKASEIIDAFIWRKYSGNGVGGLFPLRHPQQNQRKLEIWYQFHSYLNENDIF